MACHYKQTLRVVLFGDVVCLCATVEFSHNSHGTDRGIFPVCVSLLHTLLSLPDTTNSIKQRPPIQRAYFSNMIKNPLKVVFLSVAYL